MRTTKSAESAGIVGSLEMAIGSNVHELTHKSAAAHRAENGNGEMPATDLAMLLRRVSEGSTREIDSLINELRGLRKRLESDSDRIENAIVRYAELSQGVMQLTAIISDNVKQLPESSIGR